MPLSIEETHPNIAKEWHPTRNGTRKASDFTAGSGIKVWWLCNESVCEHPHEWEAVVYSRTKSNHGCPFCSGRRVCPCNSLASLYPDIAKLKHPDEEIDLSTVAPQTNKKIRWKCPKGPDHEWIAPPSGLTHRGGGCPYCSGKRVSVTNSLSSLYPHIAAEWHPTKNGDLSPHDVTAGSNKKVAWKCPNGPDHEWKTPISARTREKGGGCPFCSKPARYVSVTNCLETLYPYVAKLWHPTKNKDTTPRNITAGSNKRYWFKCPKGPDHEWYPKLDNLTLNNRGCPFCAGAKVSVTNSLSSVAPELIKEWHPTKNGDVTPDDIVALSGKKRWWKCEKGPDHEWDQSPGVRIGQGVGCPMCSGIRVSVTNSLQTKRPEVAKLWHPTKNGNLTPDDIVSKSNKKFWWRCELFPGHEWRTSASSIAGCPTCFPAGFNKDKPGYYYSMRIHNSGEIWWWKGGISHNPDRRLTDILQSLKKVNLQLQVDLVESIFSEDGLDCLDLEKKLLNVKEIRLKTIEKFSGSRELFSENPLEYARKNGFLN